MQICWQRFGDESFSVNNAMQNDARTQQIGARTQQIHYFFLI